MTTTAEFIIVPTASGAVAVNREHVVKVGVDREPNAVGQHAGKMTLRIYCSDNSIVTCRGTENVRQALADLNIPSFRPKPKTEEEESAA